MSFHGPIVLVGAGNMGGAILRGWIDSGMAPETIFVSDPFISQDFASFLDEQHVGYGPKIPDGLKAGCLMLAIKPQIMNEVLPHLSDHIHEHTAIISIAAGTTIASIKTHLPQGIVVRSMPNTPAMVGRGVTGLVAETQIDGPLRSDITDLLKVCGAVEWVESEAQLDALMAVSGCGPAYVFYLAEVMAAAGRELGLEADLAMRLAKNTVTGAGELMYQSSDAPEQLRKNVTSPGGTTAAALNVLMHDGAMAQLFEQALKAAKHRADELG